MILSTMMLDMVAVLFGGVTALLPVFATDVLHVGATGFGWLRAMPSIGAIAMSFWLATRPPIRTRRTTLLWAVVAFGVATIVFGLSKSYPLVTGDAVFARGGGQYLGRDSLDGAATDDARFDARPGVGGGRNLHRHQQRDRRVRIGHGRPVDWAACRR